MATRPADRAGDDAEHAGLTLGDPFGEHPGQGGGRGGDLVTSIAMPARPLAATAGAGVEAEPAHPQQRGADDG